ncbi:hypothetical protein [Pantoea cypripedii]|uniref:Uncharacterized protein n=1 Tax=Pantoea cypripedii TaxID=55209 RepID=A0A1X1EW10_PANCY|nr:hypothetical protein [Pantoea cypripedii]MBP2198240.1 hypothetical protein [Pantoea cypripedii]ORM94073.1 hypothetical protein HA50_12200 [Pantoea cypripedii]
MIADKYIPLSAVLISVAPVSVQAGNFINNNDSLITNVSGTTADIKQRHQVLNTDDSLLKAENVYSIDMDPDQPLTFSKTQSVQSLTVNFKTQSQIDKVVKATELKLILPAGVVRSTHGDIVVRCSQHTDCKYDIDNTWTGKEGHQMILLALDLQPGESYSLTVPLTLEKTLPAELAPIEAAIGQSASVKLDSADRIVAQNSVTGGKKNVKVETRVSVHALEAGSQKVKDKKTFTAHVVAEGMESTDKLSLTDGTHSWPMTLQTECDVKDASCFNADLPIPTDPFSFSLTAVVIAQNEELNRTQLVTPLKDDSITPFNFLMQCPGSPADAAQPCTLNWGDENRPAPIPYLADDSWLTLSSLYKQHRITAGTYQAINDAIKESGPLILIITNVGWKPLSTFENTDKAPTVNKEHMDTGDKDVHGLITPGDILPQYGTLHFYYSQ